MSQLNRALTADRWQQVAPVRAAGSNHNPIFDTRIPDGTEDVETERRIQSHQLFTDYFLRLAKVAARAGAAKAQDYQDLHQAFWSCLIGLTRRTSLTDVSDYLARSFWIEPWLLKFITEVEFQLQKAISEPASCRQLPLTEQIAQLRFIAERLKRRSETMSLFAEDRRSVLHDLVIRRVIKDARCLGVLGIEVSIAAKVTAVPFEHVLFDLRLFHEGKPVHVRPRWSGWRVVGAQPDEQTDQSTVFSSARLIEVQQQQMVIDELNFFVPYAALDVLVGLPLDFDIEVRVCNHSGLVRASDARAEVWAVSQHELRTQPIPSPIEIDFNSDSPSHGSMTRFAARFNRELHRERIVPVIEIQADLMFVDMADKPTAIEIRFLSHTGEAIDSEHSSYRHRDGSFRYRTELRCHRMLEIYSDWRVAVPLVALEIDESVDQIQCELVVLDSDGRVLFGDIAVVAGSRRDLAQAKMVRPSHALETARFRPRALRLESTQDFCHEPRIRCLFAYLDVAPRDEPIYVSCSIRPFHAESRQETLQQSWLVCQNTARHEYFTEFFFQTGELERAFGGLWGMEESSVCIEVLALDGRRHLIHQERVRMPSSTHYEKGSTPRILSCEGTAQIVDAKVIARAPDELEVTLALPHRTTTAGDYRLTLNVLPTESVNAHGHEQYHQNAIHVSLEIVVPIIHHAASGAAIQQHHRFSLPRDWIKSDREVLCIDLYDPMGQPIQHFETVLTV